MSAVPHPPRAQLSASAGAGVSAVPHPPRAQLSGLFVACFGSARRGDILSRPAEHFLGLALHPRTRYPAAMSNEVELAAPAFLLAVPQLGDPNFNRSVVLLLEHTDEGSMGLVLNRPTTLDVDEFCRSQDMEFQGDGSALVYQGGPVQTDRAFILHESGHQGPETEDINDALKFSYSLESMRALVASPPARLRFYLGYAGWGPEQLAEEVAAGAWLIAQPTAELIFEADPEQTWEVALRQLGIDPMQLMHSGTIH